MRSLARRKDADSLVSMNIAYMLMDLGHRVLELPSSASFARQLRPQEANQDNGYNASPAECATGLHGDTENFRIEQPGR